MAITYCKVQRKNPLKPIDAPRWYAQSKAIKVVDLEQIAEEIAYASSATKGDIMLVLDGVIMALARRLSEGEIVRFGELGSFRCTLKNRRKIWDEALEDFVPAAPYDSKDFSASRNIESCSIRFEPGPILKNMCKTAKFRAIDGGTILYPPNPSVVGVISSEE